MDIEMHLVVGMALALCGFNGLDDLANATHVELFLKAE